MTTEKLKGFLEEYPQKKLWPLCFIYISRIKLPNKGVSFKKHLDFIAFPSWVDKFE